MAGGFLHRKSWVIAAVTLLSAFTGPLLPRCHAAAKLPTTTPPPLPLPPLPTASQLKWQRREVITFFHFGMNTFTDSEWGTGSEDTAVFHPGPAMDVGQWLDQATKAVGASLAILVAKHHDGFCLWPTAYTDHSVARSPWKGGGGDVVSMFAEAAKARGIDVGIYLSPWDRHERSYGNEREYNEYYLAQLRELLTGYGNVSEIWFDGAKGKNATKMNYYFDDWFQLTKQLQGSINIFSDAGPDIRWVGDENGYAGTTSWSTVHRDKLRIGDATLINYLNTGDPDGTDWVPPECDVSIRKGWFWHKNETAKPLRQLLDIYYKSVGRNCVLLLNVPPNSSGLVDAADARRLRDFRRAVDAIFYSTDLTGNATAAASSERGGRAGGFSAANVLSHDDHKYWAPDEGGGHEHWVELHWPKGEEVDFNVVRIQEPVWMGQRVETHQVYADGRLVANGTTVGYNRLHRLNKPVRRASRLRVRFLNWRRRGGRPSRGQGGGPLIAAVRVHYDPYWDGKWGTYEV